MYKELKEALKAAVAAVKPIRERIRTTTDRERYDAWDDKRRGSGYRRTLHLALCYLRSTPYLKAEPKTCYADKVPAYVRDGWVRAIADTLIEYGCVPEGSTPESVKQDVQTWMQGGAVEVPRTARPRLPKLYIVVRADLSAGAQAVQAAHAMREFAAEHPEIEKEWHEKSNTVVMLSVQYESWLKNLLHTVKYHGVAVTGFREPDLSNTLTAICVGPDGYRIQELRTLPLALKEKAA